MDYYRIEFKKPALKELKSLPKNTIKNVFTKITSLKNDPFPQGVKKLSGVHDLFRIRVSEYRVIYSVDKIDKIIIVQYIRHRKDVYRYLK